MNRISSHGINKKKNSKELNKSIKQANRNYNTERSRYLNIISENISVPHDIIKNAPLLTLHGRTIVYIENQKKVLEYTDSIICIQASQCIIRIEGNGLKISYCTEDEMKITGVVSSIKYT